MPNESQRLLLKFNKKFGVTRDGVLLEFEDGLKTEATDDRKLKAFVLKAYQQGVKDSLGELPKYDQYDSDIIAHMEGFSRAIKESEASIKSLIE